VIAARPAVVDAEPLLALTVPRARHRCCCCSAGITAVARDIAAATRFTDASGGSGGGREDPFLVLQPQFVAECMLFTNELMSAVAAVVMACSKWTPPAPKAAKADKGKVKGKGGKAAGAGGDAAAPTPFTLVRCVCLCVRVSWHLSVLGVCCRRCEYTRACPGGVNTLAVWGHLPVVVVLQCQTAFRELLAGIGSASSLVLTPVESALDHKDRSGSATASNPYFRRESCVTELGKTEVRHRVA
jgi:hypothetical protein